MMTRMQYEVNDRKGIGWERVIDDSQGFWWHEHGMLACFHDRPLESSRAYRESLRVEPKGQYALGALLSLGRVYLGQGLFAEAERAFGELYDGMSRAAEQEFVGKSTVQATRLLQLSASAQAALAAGGAAGDADAAAAERQMVDALRRARASREDGEHQAVGRAGVCRLAALAGGVHRRGGQDLRQEEVREAQQRATAAVAPVHAGLVPLPVRRGRRRRRRGQPDLGIREAMARKVRPPAPSAAAHHRPS